MQHHKKAFLYLSFVVFCVPNMLCMELATCTKETVISGLPYDEFGLVKKCLDFRSLVQLSRTCQQAYKDKDNDLSGLISPLLSSDDYLHCLIYFSCNSNASNNNAAKVQRIIEYENASTQKMRYSIQWFCGCVNSQRSRSNAPKWFINNCFGENSRCALLMLQKIEIDVKLSVDDKRPLREFARQAFMALCAAGKCTNELLDADVKFFGGTSTILHQAIERENNRFFKLLFSLVENKDIVNHLGRTVLHCAVIHHNLEIIKFLCDNSGIHVNYHDKEGYTALFHACASGSNCQAKKLLYAAPGIDLSPGWKNLWSYLS